MYGTSPIRVRLDRALLFFTAPRNRRDEVEVIHDGTASLGHVVQSLGVPLTEVGSLRVDGEEVPVNRRPRPGATVSVEGVRRPQEERERFVLDVHLGTLARRLRLLGVDAAYRNDAGDDELVEQSSSEGRLLLTKDRALLRRRAVTAGAYVRGSQPFEQLTDVLERFVPPLRPWTRCVSCNGELRASDKGDVVDELEPGTRRCYDVFARCTRCGQVYWRGAHAHELDAVVEAARSVHPRAGTAGLPRS